MALKCLAPHLLRDEEGPKRFEREEKAAPSLDHPNISAVHEINRVDGRTLLAMLFREDRFSVSASRKGQAATGFRLQTVTVLP